MTRPSPVDSTLPSGGLDQSRLKIVEGDVSRSTHSACGGACQGGWRGRGRGHEGDARGGVQVARALHRCIQCRLYAGYDGYAVAPTLMLVEWYYNENTCFNLFSNFNRLNGNYEISVNSFVYLENFIEKVNLNSCELFK